MSGRTQRRVDLQYRLAGADGTVSADTQRKTWFFDLPVERDRPEAWRELLSRIFYDANVNLRLRTPGDDAWLALDGYEVGPVEAAGMLAWDGSMTQESVAGHLPWLLAARRVVWEFTACYLVDGSGAYDGMEGEDFAELVLYRAVAAGRVDGERARGFLERLYPGKGDFVYGNREQRLRNLVEVRPARQFRREPGAQPWVSGPVGPDDLRVATERLQAR